MIPQPASTIIGEIAFVQSHKGDLPVRIEIEGKSYVIVRVFSADGEIVIMAEPLKALDTDED